MNYDIVSTKKNNHQSKQLGIHYFHKKSADILKVTKWQKWARAPTDRCLGPQLTGKQQQHTPPLTSRDRGTATREAKMDTVLSRRGQARVTGRR